MIKRRKGLKYIPYDSSEDHTDLEIKKGVLIVRLKNTNVIHIFNSNIKETATSGNHR